MILGYTDSCFTPAINSLKELEKAQTEIGPRAVFIENLLYGKEGAEGWKPLELQAKYPNTEELDRMSKAIENEIKHTSFWRRNYLAALKKTLEGIKFVQKRLTPEISQEQATALDTYYDQTQKTYQGKLIVPINQAFDPRTAASLGECEGFSLHWIAYWLNEKKPFGRSLNFPPIKFDSPAGRKFPGLNHLGRLTDEVYELQRLQPENTKDLTEAKYFSDAQLKKMSSHGKPITSYAYDRSYVGADELANTLVECLRNKPDNAYKVELEGLSAGHAFAVAKKAGQIHFMEPSRGWFCFENEKNFKRWMPFHFKQTDLADKMQLTKYHVKSYSNNPEPNTHPELQPQPRYLWRKFLQFFSYRREVMLLKKLGTWIGNKFTRKKDDKVEEPRLQTKDDCLLKTKNTYTNIAGMLDISSEDMVKAQRSLANSKFPLTPTPPLEDKQEPRLHIKDGCENPEDKHSQYKGINNPALLQR